ncbi:NrsF family protein [Mesorhizobium sp. 1M-11]|uniref:NrsF family protein n=1 Tax=Mesorhizobium sp. 1M-11 TaxID=1529006 RepID=UPI0006C748CA|nr:NrsF family protein [Mesorhizobium sp. 1M-11]
MDTNRLIETLAGERRQWPPDPTLALRRAAVLATALAAAIVLLTFSIRPDLAIVAKTPGFAWKLASTVSLGVSAFGLVLRLSRPGDDWRPAAANLTVAPMLLVMGSVADFLPGSAMLSTVSTNPNGFVCLAGIVLAGLAPLGIVVAALRQGAPTRPAIAGAAAGLLAGSIVATFFAAHCASDSLLFVATWYTLAAAILAALGATVAHRLIRW